MQRLSGNGGRRHQRSSVPGGGYGWSSRDPRRRVTREARVVIIGAGPAGLSAAEEAAVHGLAVDVVEESARLGGQYFRSRQTSLRPGSPRHFSAARTGARVRVGTVMVDAEPGAVVVWSSDLGTEALPYDALVVATGAYDRPVSIPGWTLPGVVTAGGAHTLAKSYGLAPGRRMVVAGAGPFLLSVSTALATHGYDVETFDATPWSAVVRGTLVLAQHPTYLLQGAWLTGKLLRHGESVHHGQMITAIHGTERVEAVSVAAVDADWAPRPGTERVIDADGVCLGFGFVPSLEIAQLLGCDIRYSRRTSDYSVVTDPWMRCSEERIYAAGEVTGIAGVEFGRCRGPTCCARGSARSPRHHAGSLQSSRAPTHDEAQSTARMGAMDGCDISRAAGPLVTGERSHGDMSMRGRNSFGGARRPRLQPGRASIGKSRDASGYGALSRPDLQFRPHRDASGTPWVSSAGGRTPLEHPAAY